MKRWNAALFGLALASCSVERVETSQTQQDLTDCVPGGNFPNATMPPVAMWNGLAPPQAGATGSYVAYNLVANGNWLVALPDIQAQQILYVTQVKPADLGKILAMIAEGNPGSQVDIPRPIPHCLHNCGLNDLAKTFLEYALRTQPAYFQARIAAGLPPY